MRWDKLLTIIFLLFFLTGQWECIYDSHYDTPYNVEIEQFSLDDTSGLRIISLVPFRDIEEGYIFSNQIVLIGGIISSMGTISLGSNSFFLMDYHYDLEGQKWIFGGSLRLFKKIN